MHGSCCVGFRRDNAISCTEGTCIAAGHMPYRDNIRCRSRLRSLYSQSPEEENEEYQQSHFEEQPTQFSSKNVRLEAIKSVGLTQLHNNTQDLISRTRQPLFEENLADAYGNKAPSIAQIQEANALETVIIDSFAAYSSKNTTFSLKGMCIDILGVEVSPDLRHARVYWCLPLSLDLHQLPHSKLEQVVKRMQQRLRNEAERYKLWFILD